MSPVAQTLPQPLPPSTLDGAFKNRKANSAIMGSVENCGYLSRLMRIKGRVDPSEQPSIAYRAQCKDSSSFNIKASLMTTHCVDT